MNWEDAETRKVDPISTREEYHGTESGPRPSVADEQATKAETKIKPQKSRFHPVEVKRTSHRAFNYLDWEDSNPEYGTDIPDSRVQSESTGSLDNPGTEVEVEAAEGMEPPPLGQPPRRVNAHGHGAVEGISDIGHRAAAALHLGTRWFMKASRQFAKDVQSTIERTRQGQRQRGRSESGKVAAYYFEWADQLSRLSPGTRAAALGAMQEEDRMEVQRILDEAELGESMLSNEHDFGSERHNVKNCAQDNKRYPKKKGNQQKQHPVSAAAPTSAVAPPPPPPPPPQYEELMTDGYQVDDDKTAHERKHSHYEEHADLLGMENVAHQPQQPPASNSMKTQGTSQETMSIIRDMFESNDKSTENAVAINHTHEQYFTSTSSTKTTEPSDENEPEIRRNLRERRVAETQQRMMRQLAEKRARDDVEDAEKTGKIALRESLRPKINSWTAGKKDNIRALLSTLHIVLWENSGWTSPGIADIVEPAKVRRWYMKANLVIHPDKVKQKHGTLEQVATAEMVFDVLKAAWGKFEATNR